MLLWACEATPEICNEEIFGRVHPFDCMAALEELPFAKQAHTVYLARAPRRFVEPQFQSPKFDAVDNPFQPRAIAQLTKIWKHSE